MIDFDSLNQGDLILFNSMDSDTISGVFTGFVLRAATAEEMVGHGASPTKGIFVECIAPSPINRLIVTDNTDLWTLIVRIKFDKRSSDNIGPLVGLADPS